MLKRVERTPFKPKIIGGGRVKNSKAALIGAPSKNETLRCIGDWTGSM